MTIVFLRAAQWLMNSRLGGALVSLERSIVLYDTLYSDRRYQILFSNFRSFAPAVSGFND